MNDEATVREALIALSRWPWAGDPLAVRDEALAALARLTAEPATRAGVSGGTPPRESGQATADSGDGGAPAVSGTDAWLEARDGALYALNPNQGERPDPSLAGMWLRTTLHEDHPNYVAVETLRGTTRPIPASRAEDFGVYDEDADFAPTVERDPTTGRFRARAIWIECGRDTVGAEPWMGCRYGTTTTGHRSSPESVASGDSAGGAASSPTDRPQR